MLSLLDPMAELRSNCIQKSHQAMTLWMIQLLSVKYDPFWEEYSYPLVNLV